MNRNVIINVALVISDNDDPNHFHKDYFGKAYRWHTPRVDRMEMAYINATVGGHLEVLERVDYSTLF